MALTLHYPKSSGLFREIRTELIEQATNRKAIPPGTQMEERINQIVTPGDKTSAMHLMREVGGDKRRHLLK